VAISCNSLKAVPQFAAARKDLRRVLTDAELLAGDEAVFSALPPLCERAVTHKCFDMLSNKRVVSRALCNETLSTTVHAYEAVYATI